MKKIEQFFKKYWFVIFIVISIIIKHILTINLPMNVRDDMGADEYLMLYLAENLVKGNYLGPYNCFTLVKGIGFPLFLAFAYKLGISYLSLYSLFYSVACLITLVPIRKMIKNRFMLLVIFITLLFCPATIDNNVQLVYRNMLIIPQSLILLSSLMMMYFTLYEDKNKLFGWTVLASLSWIFLWHTREDSIWSFPLVFMTYFVLILIILFGKKYRLKKKQRISRISLVTLPFLVLILSIHIISFINYKYYGIYTTNQLNNSNYTKAVMLMMKVKPKKEIEHVEITRETLQRIYKVSPTFAKLSDVIEEDYEHKNGLVMAGEDNGEINEDLITWELLGAASAKGYYETASKAEKFWGKVYAELNGAIDAGKIETRVTLPSRSLIPFPTKKGSFQKLLMSIGDLFLKAASYKYSYIVIPESKYNDNIIRRYETISGAYSVRKDSAIVKVNGCVFSKNNNININIGFEDDNGNLLKMIEMYDSEDVYNYYIKEENNEYYNAKKCRYNDYLEITDLSDASDIYLVVRNNFNEKLAYYNINHSEDSYLSDEVLFIGNDFHIEFEKDPMFNKAVRHVRIANYIKNFYAFGGVFCFYISLIYYFYLTMRLLLRLFSKKVDCFDKWIYLSAILGSVTVIIVGLGYVNAFMVGVNGYLSSCNGLLNLFIISSLAFLIQEIVLFFQNKVLKCLMESKNRNIREITHILVKFDTKKMFKEKTDNTFIQFFRYLFVGGFAAVVNIGMLYVFTDILHLFYLVSNILSFILGLIVNYLLSKKFVFQENTNISKMKEFITYAMIGIIGLGIDTIFIWIFTDIINLHYMVSKLISTVIVFIWNFGARKILYKIVK